MTSAQSPYTARPDDQQLSAAETATVAAIAAYLATRGAAKAVRLPTVLVGRLMSLGLSQRAVREASRMTLVPPLTGRTRWGSPTVPTVGDNASVIEDVTTRHSALFQPGGLLTAAAPVDEAATETLAVTAEVVSAARTVAADEPWLRALYLLNAAKRLTAAILANDFAQALKNERRYLNQHRAAGIERRAGAAAVDEVAARSTGYLVWVGGTCPQCAPLDGQVFRPGNMPLPPIHPGCRCSCRPL